MRNPKAGKARCRLKTHMKSQMRRSHDRKSSQLLRKLDNDGVITHHHTRQIIDRVKPYPEMVKVYGGTKVLIPLKAIPQSAIKKESKLVYIVIDVPARGDQKAGKARVTIGFKVTMMDRSGWLYHFRFHTWTQHKVNGTKESFGSSKSLLAKMGHCKPLMAVLSSELLANTQEKKS